MASVQAATPLEKSAAVSPAQHRPASGCSVLVPCFPPYGKSAEVYVQNARKFTGKQQTLQEFWKVQPAQSGFRLAGSHVMNL
jgi:hypothetical protein